MKKVNKVRFPAEWLSLQAGEFMFSRKPYHDLLLVQDELRKEGVMIGLVPTSGGYQVHCEDTKMYDNEQIPFTAPTEKEAAWIRSAIERHKKVANERQAARDARAELAAIERSLGLGGE